MANLKNNYNNQVSHLPLNVNIQSVLNNKKKIMIEKPKIVYNTVSPNKDKRADILSQEHIKVHKVRKLISENKIIIENKPIPKAYSVIHF